MYFKLSASKKPEPSNKVLSKILNYTWAWDVLCVPYNFVIFCEHDMMGDFPKRNARK